MSQQKDSETDEMEMATMFTSFPKLPIELRHQIWHQIAFEPQVVHLAFNNPDRANGRDRDWAVGPQSVVPALLHTNREARLVGLTHYPHELTRKEKKTYVNFDRDVIWIANPLVAAFMLNNPLFKDQLKKLVLSPDVVASPSGDVASFSNFSKLEEIYVGRFDGISWEDVRGRIEINYPPLEDDELRDGSQKKRVKSKRKKTGRKTKAEKQAAWRTRLLNQLNRKVVGMDLKRKDVVGLTCDDDPKYEVRKLSDKIREMRQTLVERQGIASVRQLPIHDEDFSSVFDLLYPSSSTAKDT